jgi:hypothetical protein
MYDLMEDLSQCLGRVGAWLNRFADSDTPDLFRLGSS